MFSCKYIKHVVNTKVGKNIYKQTYIIINTIYIVCSLYIHIHIYGVNFDITGDSIYSLSTINS